MLVIDVVRMARDRAEDVHLMQFDAVAVAAAIDDAASG